MPLRSGDVPRQIATLVTLVREHLFKRANNHEEKLLVYLALKWSEVEESNRNNLSEKAIGIALFDQKPDWNPSDAAAPSIVRVTASRLRKHLRHFFKYILEGRNCDQRLELPEGSPYLLKILKNRLELDPVERFWDAHIINGVSGLIIYTEPLFFWDEKNRAFLRYLDINNDSDDPEEIRRKLIAKFGEHHPSLQMTPCFHYQASGEIHALRRLQHWFDTNEVPYSVTLSRGCGDESLYNHNLIVLGNTRTNRFLRKLQTNCDLTVKDKAIQLRNPDLSKGERGEYRDAPYTLATQENECIYAVVTRLPLFGSKTCATLIGSNHGRALEKAAEYVTSVESLRSLFQRVGLGQTESLPAQFQILFKVEGLSFDTALGEAEPVVFRPLAHKAVASRSARVGKR